MKNRFGSPEGSQDAPGTDPAEYGWAERKRFEKVLKSFDEGSFCLGSHGFDG